MAVLASGGVYLQDGFQEIFSFRGHKLHVRGILPVDVADHDRGMRMDSSRRDQFISWDVKALLLWQDKKNGSPPEIIARYNFPKNQPQFISAIVYIPRMKVFVGAALDMTFKIFDKQFNVLQVLHHEERAILSLEYDNDYEKGIILAAGASGITVWRFYRNLTIGNEHVMEKMFTFDGFNQWVSSMIYEPRTHKLYALADRSVNVLSFKRRCVVTVLKDIHEAPVTQVCWYARSQFYLTGCSQGLIKCWTSHFRDINKLQNMGQAALSATKQAGDDDDEVHSVRFALLHTFICHSKAITGLILHSTSGLAISTSLDGFMKVLNLEAFNELFSVNIGTGITGMRGINYGLHMACLFSQTNGRIRLWKVTSCCNFFGISAADVEILDCFENLYPDESNMAIATRNSEAVDELDDQSSNELLSANVSQADTTVTQPEKEMAPENASDSDSDSNSVDSNSLDSITERDKKDVPNQQQTELKLHGTANTQEKLKMNRLVVSYAAQDLRVYHRFGGLVCRIEPTEVVDGIKSYAVSVYQELLFCLLHSGSIKVYCCRNPNSPFLREISVLNKGQSQNQVGNTLCLIDCLPNAFVSTTVFSQDQKRIRQQMHCNIRGEAIAAHINEVLILGTSNGSLLCMDTLNDLDLCAVCQAASGSIETVKYRASRKELFVLHLHPANSAVVIKIWKLPGLEILTETSPLINISCFDISKSLPIFGFGCIDGFTRLFNAPDISQDDCIEIEKLGLVHDGSIVAISFCDELQIFATTSLDSTLKIWDFQKRLIRSIKFNLPPLAMKFHGNVGDVVICQKNYLLQCTMAIWNEGEYYQKLQQQFDPWQTDVDNEDDPAMLAKMWSKFVSSKPHGNDSNEFDRQFVDFSLTEDNQRNVMVSREISTTGGIAIAPLLQSVHSITKKSVEFSTSVSIIDAASDAAAPGNTSDTPGNLDVYSPRFYMELKPSVQYKIPEIDNIIQRELQKEAHLVNTLKVERSWNKSKSDGASLKSRLYLGAGGNSANLSPQTSVSSMDVGVQGRYCEDQGIKSLYVARNLASYSMSPRARLVLLNNDDLNREEQSKEHGLITDSNEMAKQQQQQQQQQSEIGDANMPFTPHAPSQILPSSGKSLLKFKGGRATLVAPRSLVITNRENSDNKIEESSSMQLSTLLCMQETEVVPGTLLLSEQYKVDKQTYRMRKARLRDPTSVPEVIAEEIPERSELFKRKMQSVNDKINKDNLDAALAAIKARQEDARQKAIEEARKREEEEEQRKQEEANITAAQIDALAKLQVPKDHISQLLLPRQSTAERASRINAKSNNRKKSTIGTSHVLPAPIVPAATDAADVKRGSVAVSMDSDYSSSSYDVSTGGASRSSSLLGNSSAAESVRIKVAGIRKPSVNSNLGNNNVVLSAGDTGELGNTVKDIEAAVKIEDSNPIWVKESFSRAIAVISASRKVTSDIGNMNRGSNGGMLDDRGSPAVTKSDVKKKKKNEELSRLHAMNSFKLMGGTLGLDDADDKKHHDQEVVATSFPSKRKISIGDVTKHLMKSGMKVKV